MNKIKKPDANPVVALLLTWFAFNLGHLLVNGQQRKFIYTLIACFIGFIVCILPGIVISILSVVEAYQTAVRLQKGEEIGENEYTHPLLYKIVKLIDKEATCAQA